MLNRNLFIVIISGIALGLGYYGIRTSLHASQRNQKVWEFFASPASYYQNTMKAGTKCGEAPFFFPSNGLVGYIWDDSFRPGHRHQGIDIFAGTDVGVTPVYAAYPGYLTRNGDWKSSVIVRVPSDPLQPGRQVWVYYTHMADPQGKSYISEDFPPGVSEIPVQAGTLLGFQGNYSGDPNNPVGVHLHISVVKDDGLGHFMNELDINNTYDPSPYFGMALNANLNQDDVPVCQPVAK